ncbi:DCC1-like thiol-disulfide oxidoreductase family protein [Flavobacterium sp.]|uniref:thiol-disulfide oxidoreductase DCC family protein n=1 Tax=Flavobacterium sp. TaxID=239 RepID=UPI0025CE2BD4|nr:DCC1-like thiol-disulfide oxidoreductase family protein [Flavobacterium sp.]
MEDLPKNKKIILFDGVCNLCESVVRFVIKHDKQDIFRFVSLQSELGIAIIEHTGFEKLKIDSVLLYESDGTVYYKAEAVFKIAKYLDGQFKFLSFFSFIPIKISNLFYDFIARNRYKWFGKKESCMISTAALQSKFLT